MQIWNYDSRTGELIGPTTADPDPMQPGEWLLPAYSTSAAPPELSTGSARVFVGSGWETVPDHRGETWWLADATDNTKPVMVTDLGDPTAFAVPLTNVEPAAPPAPPPPPVIATPRQIRIALNQLGLRASIEAYVDAADQDTKDTWAFAAEFDRTNGMVAAAAEALGKTDAEIDALFELAKNL